MTLFQVSLICVVLTGLVACGSDPQSSSDQSQSDSSLSQSSQAENSSTSSSSTSSTQQSSSTFFSTTIEEGQTGYCSTLSAPIENEHQGFVGAGYTNTENAIGSGLRWQVFAPTALTVEVTVRYANGGDGARLSTLVVNGGADGEYSIDLPASGAWDAWQTAITNIELQRGSNHLFLSADSSAGLANIDSITLSGSSFSGGILGEACAEVPPTPNEELLAFPGAMGYGRYAKGGRGGRVIHVTNLNDRGPGSFRAAIDETGPRTIVFDVSGVIELQSKILITGTKGNGEVTVAAHTAPGKGIVLKGWTFGMIGGNDVVVRFLRTRIGTSSGETMDGMGMASAVNSIFDHCSVSWTIDEAFSSRGANNITLQRTLISEALNEAGHAKYDPGTQHGYCASIGGEIGSYHHNLLAHCSGRNWSLAGGLGKSPFVYVGKQDIRNNVVYNWRNRTTDGGSHEVNFVNNYYKPGPATEVFFALNAQNDGFPGTQRYYFEGNIMEGHWDESNQAAGKRATGEARDYDPWVYQPFFESFVNTQSARDAYQNVLADVGANVPMLDDHDKRIIEEVRNGTFTYRGSKTGYPGLPDNEADVGGFEEYPVVQRDASWDTDRDGMPNHWEELHGLGPNNPADGNQTNFSSVGYTNLEIYLAELAGDFN